MGCSLTGSSVHGILQGRILERVAFPSPGDLPDPGTVLGSPALQADSLPAEPQGKPGALQDVRMGCYEILGSNNNSEGHRKVHHLLFGEKQNWHKTGHTQPYKNTTGSVKEGGFFCFVN